MIQDFNSSLGAYLVNSLLHRLQLSKQPKQLIRRKAQLFDDRGAVVRVGVVAGDLLVECEAESDPLLPRHDVCQQLVVNTW